MQLEGIVGCRSTNKENERMAFPGILMKSETETLVIGYEAGSLRYNERSGCLIDPTKTG